MRGKDTVPEQDIVDARITPAYAGKSRLRSKVERNNWDHPRLCGEKVRKIILIRCQTGSPPPMRGKEDGREREIIYDRITPAYAGKSFLLVTAAS